MSDNPPDWAKKRACDLVAAEYYDPFQKAYEIDHVNRDNPSIFAFARYIAQREEPPVDPVMVEARDLVARTQHDWPDSPWHLHEAAETRAGNRDYTLVVKAAAEGVRRGIEIERERSK